MIHNTILVRESTKTVMISSQYWPIDISQDEIEEFIITRDEIKISSGSDFIELPLLIQEHKMMAIECIKDVLLIFVSDPGEDERSLSDKLKESVRKLRRVIAKDGLEALLEVYNSIVEPSIITKLKIALVGEGGTGKTTTLHLLLGDTPPLQYVPTIALNLETVENIRFGSYSLVLWDFAGQERFRKLWKFYFHGADVIFLVCDSTLRNVIISKDIFKLIKRDAPKVPVFALANKQDKPNAMKPEVVQKILGIPTYPMVAIDKSRRDEMLRILMTAAAQYVGIALPDLPASELLRFTDKATEEAVALESLRDTEEEEIELVEEVYVDEDGQIIENLEDYEIVEEVEEILEEVEEVIVLDEEEVEIVAEFSEEEEVAVVETPESPEIIEEEDIHIVAVEDEPIPVEDESPIGIEAADEFVTIEVEFETEVEPLEVTTSELDEDFEITTTSEEISEDEEPVIHFVEESVQEDVGDKTLAKDLISDLLEADEILEEELAKVSEEEIGVALEALSSDETIALDEEEARPAEEVDESVMEFAEILGALETYESEPTPVEVEDEDEMSFSDYLAEELDEILGKLQKAGKSSSSKEE